MTMTVDDLVDHYTTLVVAYANREAERKALRKALQQACYDIETIASSLGNLLNKPKIEDHLNYFRETLERSE